MVRSLKFFVCFCLILIVAKETDARQPKIDQIRQERSVKWAGMGDMGSAIPSSSPFYSFPLLLLLLNSLLLLIYLCLPPLLCLKYWLRFSKKKLRPHMHIYYGYCIEGRLAYMPSLLMTAVRAANLEVNIWNRRAPKTFTLSSSYCWDGRTSFANRCWGEKKEIQEFL